MQENAAGSLVLHHTKQRNSRVRLTGKAGSHQTPRRKHKHLDTNPSDGFLNLTAKAKASIANTEKWGYIRFFCTSKETNKMQRNLLNGRKWLQIMFLIKG